MGRKLDEISIGDIILCDPITSRGREALSSLGLAIEDVSPDYFYANLRVESKFDKEYSGAAAEETNDHSLYYQYTVNSEQYASTKVRLEEFNKRFSSDSPNQYPLLMLGVAGNGKSIEINRQIREKTLRNAGCECRGVYVNLEVAFSKIVYGLPYQCPGKTPLWLFSIKLLDEIMKYIQSCHSLCSEILKNFNEIIVKQNLADTERKNLFIAIGNYTNGNTNIETKIFQLLVDRLSSEDAEQNIKFLLETLMFIMYCSAPNQKHYIVFDNIEQYITLNRKKIQIPDSDITKLYKSLDEVIGNIIHAFDRIETDLGWKAFKIVVVLRRTSIGLLDPEFLHHPVKLNRNITDVTGYYDISEIWERKKQYIWNDRLRNKFNDSNNDGIIEIVDLLMKDGTLAVGTDYQSIIASLMNYGIRRNARAQAHSAYKTYEILSAQDPMTINQDVFQTLMSVASNSNPVHYMFRRALIEIQFKWVISNDNQDRWENLGIGHLTSKSWTGHSVNVDGIRYKGKKISIEDVSYQNKDYVTLLRRILTYLSCFPEDNQAANGQSKFVVDMFATVPVFDLIKGVLINPSGKGNISDDDFLQLARVLVALSDMSNEDTRSAPFVILGIQDKRFHENADCGILAEILHEIWDSGPNASLDGGKFSRSDFGVRITDAGCAFLFDWQASFSFMASLHCYTIPPLFFLKDYVSIRYVIETVYRASDRLCKMYENEALRFCGCGISLKMGTYLPKHKNQYVTFKQRVKELHINHLYLYRKFIVENYRVIGVFENNMREFSVLTSLIDKYILMYGNWNTAEGAPECF